MATLLIRFFELYGRKFDYMTNTISILEGGKYFSKESRQWLNESNPEMLSVEDPNNPGIDVGSSCFAFSKTRAAFEDAYEKLNNFTLSQQKKSIIDQIIYDRMKIVKFRERVKSIYGEHHNEMKSKRKYYKKDSNFYLNYDMDFPSLSDSHN